MRFRRIRRDSRIEQPPPLLGTGEQWNPATASVGFRESVRADCAPPHPAATIARRLRRCQQDRSLRGVNRKTRHARVERFRRSPPIRDENTEQISFPSRHDRQSDHADRTTPGHFHPNMTWCGTRRNNGERRRMTKRCKMAVPINQRWPHQRMLRKTSRCVAEPLPHNADLGHFRVGVAMRSSFSLSVTILAHSDGIHSNSVTQSGSRWAAKHMAICSAVFLVSDSRGNRPSSK